ncbi:MAG: molybdopterin-dependent oxidoreductase, partial [Piscinibacter sp.]|uniref:molybdopterin-dependent oxidoreductase n=1 Tax=Piscinibacter sp. TaxID=1903157 RepID=UPI003D1312F5
IDHGPGAIGALGSAHATVEELHLLAKLVRALGSENVDHRTRHADFGAAAPAGKARWLGLPIAALSNLQRVLVIGSFLRKDHPLFAQRIRQAARKGAQVHSLHALADDWLMPMGTRLVAAPSAWVQSLADIAAAVAAAKGVAAPAAGNAGSEAKAIADSLLSGERKAVLLGNAAAQHPQAASLLSLANWIAAQTGAAVGYLTEAANTVGAQLVNVQPGQGGLNAGQMLSAGSLKAALLLDVEPAFDAADPSAAQAALGKAEMVVAMSAFKSTALLDVADVLLPVAPFTETSGSFVNAEGRLQSFHGVVKPLGETRPAWKVLRVLGNMLGLSGFEFETSEQVRAEALGDGSGIAARLDNGCAAAVATQPAIAGLQRIADVPIYSADSLVRRAPALQHTADARAPQASLPAALWQQLGLAAGDRVRVSQGAASALLPAQLDATLAAGTVRAPAGHPDTATLGAAFGAVTVEKA